MELMTTDRRDEIEKKTAEILEIDEDVVHKVLSFQWKIAHTAANSTATSFEITGFGRFMIRPKKLTSRIAELEKSLIKWKGALQDPEVSERRKQTLRIKEERVTEKLITLKAKQKLHEAA